MNIFDLTKKLIKIKFYAITISGRETVKLTLDMLPGSIKDKVDENLKSTMTVDEKIELQSLDCKILNGRKVSIRATANVTITTYSNETISYIENIDDQSEMELLNKQITVNALGNSYITMVPQMSEKAAANIGRGHTIAIQHIDEIAFVNNIHITLPSLLSASGK